MRSRLARSMVGLLCLVSAAGAQDAETTGQAASDNRTVEEIVVTGSRIRRDTFATTTPILILSTEDAQRIGILNVSEMLQKSTVSSGEQIDGSFNSSAGDPVAAEAPPDGGIGSSCVNLRGLGCERGLVLVNGKRLGLAGIRGAPSQPDINMLPIGMVEAVDVLTGGLTTIYGADAVAGVVNVRLKKDFEGINLTATSDLPEHPGGELFSASMTAGLSRDTGSFMIGVEYSEQARVTTADRDYASCMQRGAMNVTEDGQRVGTCRGDNPDNWVVGFGDNIFAHGYTQVGGDGPIPHPVDASRLLYTPGSSNILGPNGNPVTGFSTFAVLPDATHDGLRGFPNSLRPFYLDRFRYTEGFNDQYDRRKADLWRPYERFSLVMQGTLDLDWGHNEEAYFEGYYFNRANDVRATTEQIIPTILAEAPLVDSDNNPILDANGAVQMVDNPLNPFPISVMSSLTLSDVPQTFDTELQQIRVVTGITADLPFGQDWSYDVSASYDRATGFVAQPILLENHLLYATQFIGVVADANGNPTNEVVCGPRMPNNASGFLTPAECVPLDLLNMSVVGDGVTTSGHFATQAERDYLVANRTNRTVTELITFQAYATGDLFSIPGGGRVGAAFGIEYRADSIDSQHSAAGVLGLNAAINSLSEPETFGERDTFDAYAEVSVPLLVDRGAADLFQVDLAVRYTDDGYHSDTVYKAGYLWDINEYVSWSSSFNTSLRAPNLREQFIASFEDQWQGTADPCRQPFVDLLEDGPTKDILLNNCALSGADVTVLGSNFTLPIPISFGGTVGLNPETSESLTSTMTFRLPQRERFGFDLAITYFDIEIEDTLVSLEPGTIISRCYFERPNLASPFCERVERNRPNATPETNFLSFVRAGYINTGTESVNGYDLTTRLSFDVAGADVTWTTGATLLKERLTQELPPSENDPDGSPIVDNVGRIGNPEVTVQSTVAVTLDRWDFVWQAHWWDDTQFGQGVVNPVITDVDGLIIGGKYDGMTCGEAFPEDGCADYGYFESSQFDTDTLGPMRPITEAEGQMLHNVSVSYNGDAWSLTAGISNLLDKEPALIDQAAGPNRNNAVTSAAYDNIGRSYFARFSISF